MINLSIPYMPIGHYLGLVLFAGPVQAETTAAGSAYVFNTLLFLMCGFLVMFMATGLPCSKVAWSEQKMSTFLSEYLALLSCKRMFYLVGYNLLYGIDRAVISAASAFGVAMTRSYS